MSVHNWWEFGKKGAKIGAVIGGLVMGALPLAAAVMAFSPGLVLGALALGAVGAIKGGFIGGLVGSTVGAFVGDSKEKDLVAVQTPNGRVIDVPAKDLQRAQEMESRRFQDMVEQSRGGSRAR